jgi:cytochrome c2
MGDKNWRNLRQRVKDDGMNLKKKFEECLKCLVVDDEPVVAPRAQGVLGRAEGVPEVVVARRCALLV